MMGETDKPNPVVLPLLTELQTNIDHYDVSTFKAKLREIMEVVDDRHYDDRTDFSFERRRSDD